MFPSQYEGTWLRCVITFAVKSGEPPRQSIVRGLVAGVWVRVGGQGPEGRGLGSSCAAEEGRLGGVPSTGPGTEELRPGQDDHWPCEQVPGN